MKKKIEKKRVAAHVDLVGAVKTTETAAAQRTIGVEMNLEEYWCGICREIASNPHVTVPCQHLFCKSCCTFAIPGPCPGCRQPVTSIMYDRKTCDFLNQYCGDTVIPCSLCSAKHAYKDPHDCSVPQTVMYFVSAQSTDRFKLWKHSELKKDIVVAEKWKARALTSCLKTNDRITAEYLDVNSKDYVVFTEQTKNAFDVLKTRSVYLYEVNGESFYEPSLQYFRAVAHSFVSETVPRILKTTKIDNVYEALLSCPDVILISEQQRENMVCEHVAKKISQGE